VVSLKQYIARHDLARRTSRTMKPPKSRRHMREDVGDVGVLALTGLDVASLALPAWHARHRCGSAAEKPRSRLRRRARL
jgi:hypothetical protein